MVKTFNCPICEVGKIQISVPATHEVVFSGKFKELDCKAYCKVCKRQIKYKLEKTENKQ